MKQPVARQALAFFFRDFHLTRRYLSWVIVFAFYAFVNSATIALIGVAANDYQLTLTLVIGVCCGVFFRCCSTRSQTRSRMSDGKEPLNTLSWPPSQG